MAHSDLTQTSTIVASEKSTHRVEVFPLPQLIKHPNADALSVIRIPHTDYTYVVRTEDLQSKTGELVAWVPPESIIDTKRPEFAFLGANGSRVRAKKLRGIVSYGVLIPLPLGHNLKPGDDAAEFLGVTHYDPELTHISNKTGFFMGGELAKPPAGIFPKYDVDSYLRYGRLVFREGETVFITEKVNGCNGRFVFKDGEMYCGSRNEWKKEYSTPPKITLEELTIKIGDAEKAKAIFEKAVNNHCPKKNFWWEALDQNPSIRKFCESHPGWCVYGEVYGQVGKYPYGIPKGKFGIALFDILIPPIDTKHGHWLDADEFIRVCDEFQLPRVPLLSIEPYNFDKCLTYSEGVSTLDKHIREGCVVRPKHERWDEALGRVCLKIINPKYLESN